jgi:hypothetical protein
MWDRRKCVYPTVLRIRDVYPGSRILFFYPSRIPDPETSTKERGEKNLLSYLFLSHKFPKIVNYFIFEMLKKKIWPIFKEFYNFLPKNLSLSSKNYMFGIRDPRSGIRDPGSEIRNKPFPDPGVKAPDPGTQIRIRNNSTLHCSVVDPDRVRSKSFCRIRIRISSKQMKK